MSETYQPTQPNEPGARTETGELKPVTTPTETPETPKAPAQPEPKPEAKIEEGKTLLSGKEAKTGAPAGAPEQYADFKAPENYELDKEAVAEATPIFKELGLNQDQAQRLVDLYAKTSQRAADAPVKFWQDQQQKWRDEVQADPELGGRLDQVKTTVARAIDGLGDQKLANDFREAMDYTGAGNNPAFIRAFYRLAQKVTEGSSVPGSGPSPMGQRAPGAGPRSVASALYPNLPE